MMTDDTPDRIEKQIDLKAPLATVWAALTDHVQFGRWFGVRVGQPFTPGATIRCAITPTTVDATVAAAQKPHEGKTFDIYVERIEPTRLFSFRWHPYAIDEGRDYSREPTTLVEFTLEEVAGGVRLRVTESGFSGIPADRRAQAFAMNDGGWAMQTTLIAKYLAR
ncbi:MAG TPA: SRPBCC family protein [Vicinamibacterales bacterium]|nr:SRPBCC family protein [Vicinamibacterales bacterium]